MPTAREANFDEFVKALKRTEKPNHLPFYEHIASSGFIAEKTGTSFNRMSYSDDGYFDIFVDFWLSMGFDCVPMEVMLNCPLAAGDHAKSIGSESHAKITNWQEFEEYPWPAASSPIEFSYFEKASKLIPDGVKIVGGVGMGPYEWVSQLMGVVGLSLAMVDYPDLVDAMFEKIGSLIIAADKQLAEMDFIGALRQGDDLGFKTSTFLPPDVLRKHVLPVYREIAATAHAQNKPFILHSCGNLEEIYEDLIDCGIDAKHSYEDAILPVGDFKKRYGDRITPLGGLDVDVICRAETEELRKYTREHIEACFADGFWALGTGNSLTDYMPVKNYLTVLEVGLEYSS